MRISAFSKTIKFLACAFLFSSIKKIKMNEQKFFEKYFGAFFQYMNTWVSALGSAALLVLEQCQRLRGEAEVSPPSQR